METTIISIKNKEIKFSKETGNVLKVSKRVETSLNVNSSVKSSSSVLGGSHNVSVKSSNTTVTEIWLKDGDYEKDHTIRADLSLREDQQITVFTASTDKNSVYIGLLNHNTKQFQRIGSTDSILTALGFFSPFTVLKYVVTFFLGFIGFSLGWFAGLLTFGGAIYFIYSDNKQNKIYAANFDEQVRKLC